MMRSFLCLVGLVGTGVSLVVLLWAYAHNIDMTQMRFFVTYWPYYLALWVSIGLFAAALK